MNIDSIVITAQPVSHHPDVLAVQVSTEAHGSALRSDFLVDTSDTRLFDAVPGIESRLDAMLNAATQRFRAVFEELYEGDKL